MTRRPTLPILALLFAACCAGGAAAQLAGADRDNFVGSSIRGCAETAEQDKLPIPPDTMKLFCTCMADKQADMTTKADLDYFGAHQTLSDDYGKRVAALAPDCRTAAGLAK
ncbi:MAG TPA: hypothetical protein VHW66_14370 [Stellaceae bacterium]|jgi:hypothetical protein|nr:hypothetical protein [Stellaceae bacterium]